MSLKAIFVSVLAFKVLHWAATAEYFQNVEVSQERYKPNRVMRVFAPLLGLAFVGALAWGIYRSL